MYRLIIGKSKSKNFKEVINVSRSLGGVYDGDKITIELKEIQSAYIKLYPLFKYNVFQWKNTKAYFNGNEVNPYTSILQAHLKKNKDVWEIFNLMDDEKSSIPESFEILNTPFLYYKRESNIFYFKNEYYDFDLELEGKKFIDFIDSYDIGDLVYFN